MKKLIMILILACLAIVGFGQDVTPVVTEPAWYATAAFWLGIVSAAIFIINLILGLIPSTGKLSFILRTLVKFLEWIQRIIPDKRKTKQ